MARDGQNRKGAKEGKGRVERGHGEKNICMEFSSIQDKLIFLIKRRYRIKIGQTFKESDMKPQQSN